LEGCAGRLDEGRAGVVHDHADLGDAQLHYATAGEGPPSDLHPFHRLAAGRCLPGHGVPASGGVLAGRRRCQIACSEA